MKPNDFPDAVRRTAERYDMDLSRLLVLVSGGPDSVAMLRALVELGSRPAVLHLDHGLRGEESREDAEFVRGLCEGLGVECEVRRLRFDGGANLQERVRLERYRVAESVAGERGLDAIATGHTADDVAETVLLNLARGAGLRGLSGIPPVRGRYVRPLIERRRTEILAYLERLGQPYRTDPTNLTGKYTRNRVRLEVLPVLEELYPGAAANMARGAALAREDLEALEGLAADAIHLRGNEVFVREDELLALLPAVRRYAIRGAYSVLASDAPPLGSAHVEDVLGLACGGEGTRTLDLPGGVMVAGRTTGEIVFYFETEAFSGEWNLLAGRQGFEGWDIDVTEIRGFDVADAARPEVAYLDAGRGPYRVRLAREGDTIHPLGLGGTKKVLRAMMDRGVPKDLRRRTPVVVDGRGKVAWVFLGELGEEFGVGEATKEILRVEVEKQP